MSLASEIAASVQRITVDVRVDGRPVSEVIEVTVSMGFDQANAQATLYCRARPSWAEEGRSVEIWAGYNGATAKIFGGELSGLAWEDGFGRVGLDCRDLLARTRLEWGGGAYEYTEQDDAAVIRNLLEKMGIPSSQAHIESSGWTLGVIQAVPLDDGDVPFSLIERIDNLAGYRTFTDSSGVIRRMRVSGTPGPSGALSITTAQLVEKPRRTRTRDGIVNKCIVTGLTYEGLSVGGEGVAEASAANPYVPDPPGFVTEKIQDDLVEDDVTALQVAQRVVADKNRRPEALELTIVGDPRVQPGMTLSVTEDALETGAANVFVEHVEHRITATSFTTTIRTTGGTLSGYVASAPLAAFDLQLFLEGEDTGSGVNGIVVGVADASQSYDPDGLIASYDWALSATGATPDPTSGTGPIFRFTVPSSATDITLELTVTDADGLTNALSRTIPLTKSALLVEDLYTAEGATVACSADGEQTWREATPPSGNATCLMPIAPAWGQLWGTDTGHIYATFDKLLSDLVDLGAPAGAVACTAVWVHEADPTRLWAGFADGKVYFGALDTTAQTASWTLAGTVPAGPVREIRETLAALGSLRATAGAGYYASEDGGATWALLHSFDTAWRMAAGWDLNLASGLNDASPLYDEGGVTPSVPAGVTHVRGLTLGWRTKALYAADDAANLYATDETLASLADSSDDAPAGVNHMIRSGNVDGVIYLACGDGTGDNGAAKWIPGVKAPFFIRRSSTRAAQMVGYGPSHPLQVVYAGTILTVGAIGGATYNKLCIHQNGIWSFKDLPATRDDWGEIRANPFDPRKLLLFGRDTGFVESDNALYYSDDFGDTWTLVFQDIAAESQWLMDVRWSPTDPHEWALVATTPAIEGYAVRGSDATYTTHTLGSGAGDWTGSAGRGGDIVVQDVTNPTRYLDNSGVLHSGVDSFAYSYFVNAPGADRKMAAFRENSVDVVYITDDYRTGDWRALSGIQARHYGGVLTDGTLILGETGALYDGVGEVPDAWGGSPALVTKTGAGITAVGALAVDEQSHTLAAAIADQASPETMQIIARSPSGIWTVVGRPPGATTFAAIEIVGTEA